MLLSHEGIGAFFEEEGRQERIVPVLTRKSYPYDKLNVVAVKSLAPV